MDYKEDKARGRESRHSDADRDRGSSSYNKSLQSHHSYRKDKDSQDYSKSRNYNRDMDKGSKHGGGRGYGGGGHYNRSRYNRETDRSYNSRKRSHSRGRDQSRGLNEVARNPDSVDPTQRSRSNSGDKDRSESSDKHRKMSKPRSRSRDRSHKTHSHSRGHKSDEKSGGGDHNIPSNVPNNSEKQDDDDEEDLRPVLLNITCPAATTLVKQIEQRKHLFSKKDKPEESTSTSSVWQQTKFNDDSDGKVSAKFKRLMGMKNLEQAKAESGTQPTKSALGTQSKDFFVNLEKQYEVARTITHTQRGMGLGFGSSSGLINRGPTSTKEK